MPLVRPVRPAQQAPSGRRGLSTLEQLFKELGIEVDPQLLELSLTHRSFAYEAGQIPSNERLEFLGDAVLEIIVTDHIYRDFPKLSEGELAKLRAAVVSAVSLARIARELQIGPMIRLGKGEIATGGQDKRSILADTMEAIIGCVYLCAGMDAAWRFVRRITDRAIDDAMAAGDFSDFKTIIQELCAQRGWEHHYDVVGTGPDHDRTYTATIIVDDTPRGTGVGSNKRRAEQIAAREAVQQLGDA